jgi:Zn finger protein HypA/HybF involved in hydrogenase expression
MGQTFQCNKCEFEFTAGYNHNMPGAEAYCEKCGTIYDVQSTKGYWGFEVGEELHVRVSGKKGKPEVIQVGIGESYNAWEELRMKLGPDAALELIKDGNISEYSNRLLIPIETIKCKSCNSMALKMGMSLKDNCPKCKAGKMENGGFVIF